MPYSLLANSNNPALIIYVLDVSSSMIKTLGSARRIDIVMQAFDAALRRMISWSTKGTIIAPRYRLALLIYSDHVYDPLRGIKTIREVAELGVPQLPILRSTNTAAAFLQVEHLLQAELPQIQQCPAPLVCHMTDGQYTGEDPEPIVRRIMALGTRDGNVLVENIFISDQILKQAVQDVFAWPGVLPNTELATPYARKLRAMSSPLPESYRMMILEEGYHLAEGALLMLPGITPDLVEPGFVISTASGYAYEE